MTNLTLGTWPDKFHPNQTPKQCIQAGIFGGTYFSRKDLIDVKEFPEDWFAGLRPVDYESRVNHNEVNKHEVHAGTSQAAWEAKGWMHADDPRGWFQWYCRYWLGRRHKDDNRQIERWSRFASVERGRWTNIYYHTLMKRSTSSPVISQSLLHWAYVPNVEDFNTWLDLRAIRLGPQS